jgi:hypothetical protein
MIRCKKCARLYERNQCSRIENDGHGVRHERTRYCKNRSAGAYNVECDTPLLEERIVDGATRCIVARSQEFYYFPVKDQLQSLLQRPGVVEHLWHHLNWPQQRGVLHDVYDGTEWQEWKHRGWFNSNQYQGAFACACAERHARFSHLFFSRSQVARSPFLTHSLCCHQSGCVSSLTGISRSSTPFPT